MKMEAFERVRHALTDRLRSVLGVRPPRWIRPFRAEATVSDLFPWRGGSAWDTRFDIMNMSTLLMPDAASSEEVSLVVFDDGGDLLKEERIAIEPFGMKTVRISDLAPRADQGTFACFHALASDCAADFSGGNLVERSYVSYRRRGSASPLWCYVHGNTYALSREDYGSMHSIAGRPVGSLVYRPQLRFDDCERFEMVLTNTTMRRLTATVRALDSARKLVEERRAFIPACGMAVIGFDNHEGRIALVENEGRHFMWRPVLFKYYQSGFDVLHS
jgi:hypothetical protein